MIRLLFAIILILLETKNIEAKRYVSEAKTESSAIKDFSKSLAKWPQIDLLPSKAEKTYYDSLWNPRISSTLNQKYLLNKFMETCCDFSFQTQPTGINGVYQGFASGIHIVFTNTSLKFNKKNSSLYNNQGNSLTVRIPTLIFSDRSTYKKILTLSPTYCRAKIKDSLSKLVQDSVGCELMRVFTTKFAVHKFPKIVFIPATGGDVSNSPFATSPNMYIYSQKYTKTKFIFFDPDILTRDLELDMIRYNPRNDKFVMRREENPFEATLFHEMLHCLHDYQSNRSSRSSSVISQRSKSKSLQVGTNGFSYPINNAYSNDEEYHTMYGLTSRGLDLLNESSYLAHRYGFIRMSHVQGESSHIDHRRTWWYVKNGDEDLYRYYLSPKSPIKFPKFGVGAYECSDSVMEY